MNSVDIKNNMMKLWKNVFHDSDAYISLIFDNYFDPDMVEYHEDNGHIVSALLGIPYNFGCGDRTMKGLYLCGLATIDEYRHRGIMNNLLERINNKAKERGYVFTFLIPANDGLINYYSIRGYETGMYRIEDRYTDVHDFDMDYYSELNKYDERVKNLKINLYRSLRVEIFDILHCDIYKEVIDFIYDSEHRISTYISLLHSKYDIEILIKECILSGGKIYISRNKENRISGAAFVSIDDKKRVHVKKIYHIDKASFYKILNYVKKHNQSFPISVFSYPEEVDRHVLWQKVYGAPNPDGGMLSGTYGISEKVYNVGNHAKPYGMIKILNLREI